MNLIGKYIRKKATPNGMEITFQVSHAYLATLEGLKQQEYAIEIKKPYKKRTLQQNSYLWALINEICMEEDGNISGAEELYLQLLEDSGAKVLVMVVDKPAVEALSDAFRRVKVLDEHKEDGKEKCTVQGVFGSSTYNTKEMAQLIDTVLRYASEAGVETEYWEHLLKGK